MIVLTLELPWLPHLSHSMRCIWKVPEHLPRLPRICEGPLEGLPHILDLVVVLLYVGA